MLSKFKVVQINSISNNTLLKPLLLGDRDFFMKEVQIYSKLTINVIHQNGPFS